MQLLHLPLELLLLILESLDVATLTSLLASSSALTTTLAFSTPSLLTRSPTLLHHAATHNHLTLLSTLLPHIPTTSKNHLNETPLTTAASAGAAGAVKLFLSHGHTDVAPALIAAAAAGHTPVVALLLMSPPHSRSTLVSALCAAAGSGYIATLNLLLLLGGVGAHECDAYGAAPLLHAAKKGRVEVVRFLLGIQRVRRWIDAQDVHGWTALHWAEFGGNEAIVELLVREGADRGVANDEVVCAGGWGGMVVVEVAA